MRDYEFLENINGIDDDLVFEAENWKRPKAHKLRIGIIAAAAAVLCGATAITAIARTRAPVEYTINEEPVEVEYTVYTDDQGREIRTYAYKLPDYALDEELEGHTAVGQVRVVARDDNRWGGWEIVDEEGNVFHNGINNKEIECEIVGELGSMGFCCVNVRDGYDMTWFCIDDDKDNGYERKDLYIIPSGDEEAHKRIWEKHGYQYIPDDVPSEDTADEE